MSGFCPKKLSKPVCKIANISFTIFLVLNLLFIKWLHDIPNASCVIFKFTIVLADDI